MLNGKYGLANLYNMKSLKEFYITERSGGIDKGCAMLYFNLPEMDKIHSMIDEEDIFDDEDGGFGLEDEPHCTLLYGFHDDEVKGEDIVGAIKKMELPDELELVNASLFENDYDVLKFDVKAPNGELHEINKMLCDNYPYSTDYPDYHPHSTICYIKRGNGKKESRKTHNTSSGKRRHSTCTNDAPKLERRT